VKSVNVNRLVDLTLECFITRLQFTFEPFEFRLVLRAILFKNAGRPHFSQPAGKGEQDHTGTADAGDDCSGNVEDVGCGCHSKL
jgi:hypothetical protein